MSGRGRGIRGVEGRAARARSRTLDRQTARSSTVPESDAEAETSGGRKETRSLPQPEVPIPTMLRSDMGFEQKVKNQIMCLVKGKLDGPWTTWAMCLDDVKDVIWNKLLKFFSFSDDTVARRQFEKYVQQTYKNTMYVARRNSCREAGLESVADMDRSIFEFPPSWISKTIWTDMVEAWLAEAWQKSSKTAKTNKNSKEDFMVYHGGAKSLAAHKEDMDKETGTENTRADVYLKAHTDKKTKKPHPNAEKRHFLQEVYTKKRQASMLEQGIEIPMTQSGEGSTSGGQPSYVGENDLAWIKVCGGVKKGRVPGFGKIQPCPKSAPKASHYPSSATSTHSVNQLEELKAEITRLNEERFVDKEAQDERRRLHDEEMAAMRLEQKKMRDMMMRLMSVVIT